MGTFASWTGLTPRTIEPLAHRMWREFQVIQTGMMRLKGSFPTARDLLDNLPSVGTAKPFLEIRISISVEAASDCARLYGVNELKRQVIL